MRAFTSATFPVLSSISRNRVATTWEEACQRMNPWAGFYAKPSRVAATMDGRIMADYQGWSSPDDGSEMAFIHYGNKDMAPGNCLFGARSDMSAVKANEQYYSPLKFADGQSATLFSSSNRLTIERHFRGMKDYGIDGDFPQRFVDYQRDPKIYDSLTAATESVRDIRKYQQQITIERFNFHISL